MNTQYIRFFETSHSKSRGRQSVFDSIQNNLNLTSNRSWVNGKYIMDSFHFVFQFSIIGGY